MVKFFGGTEGLELVLHPMKVELFRVGRPYERDEQSDTPRIAGFPILSDPVHLDTQTAKELSQILVRGRYGGIPMECKFDPGVALRFVGKSSTIEVLVCFHCGEMLAVRNGKQLEYEYFSTSELLPMVKKLFPMDANIQGLE